jgi:hypothetical protein
MLALLIILDLVWKVLIFPESYLVVTEIILCKQRHLFINLQFTHIRLVNIQRRNRRYKRFIVLIYLALLINNLWMEQFDAFVIMRRAKRDCILQLFLQLKKLVYFQLLLNYQFHMLIALLRSVYVVHWLFKLI